MRVMLPRVLWMFLPKRLQDQSFSDNAMDSEASVQSSAELLFVSANFVLFCGCLIMIVIKVALIDLHILHIWLASLLACLSCLVLFKFEIWSMYTGRVFECYLLAASQFTFMTGRMGSALSQPARFLHMLHMQNPVLVLILAWTIAPSYLHLSFVMLGILGGYIYFGVSALSECSVVETPAVKESMLGVLMSVLTITGYLVVADVILRVLLQKSAAARLAKDAFLQRISHELRTPLAAVAGFIDTFSRRSATHDVNQLKSLKLSTNVALELVDEILDWSHIQDRVPKFESFTLKDLRESTLELCSQIASKKRVKVEFQIVRGSRFVSVQQDLSQIRQVLVGLVSNSIKFCSSGGNVVVCLELQSESSSDGFLLIVSVEDNGIGFDTCSPDDLFKPFVQLNKGGKGLGLGLAIARDVVISLGGTISASSPGLGKGARFVFSVPCSVKDQGDSSVKLSRAIRKVDQTAKPNRRMIRVLCVEDSPLLLMILVKYLKQLENEFRLQIDQCSSGLSALPMIETAITSKQPYALVFTDVLMDDGVDGCELACLIRMKEEQRHLQRCRIVGVSAMTDANTKMRGRKSGFDELLKKPINLDQLREEVLKVPQVDGSVKLSYSN